MNILHQHAGDFDQPFSIQSQAQTAAENVSKGQTKQVINYDIFKDTKTYDNFTSMPSFIQA